MRVLVTGHEGYIGTVLVPMLLEAGHDVTGLDSGLFRRGTLGEPPVEVPALDIDVREVEQHHLQGFDAVLHLAGISNDPLGDLNPQVTFDINHLASSRLAKIAKEAGVPRFVFASSCSLYGAAGQLGLVTESAPFNPVTPYGKSKVLVERDVSAMADDSFTPTFLRCATAYGVSPRLRADLVVNNLVGYALTQGEVLIKSDGTPWRPLVHIADISRAYLAVLHAPRELVHNEAFNVGRTQENYQVRQVAAMVKEVVPNSTVTYAEGGEPDLRCYQVDCTKLETTLPDYKPEWTVRKGVQELYDAYVSHKLDYDSFIGAKFLRIKEIHRLQESEQLGADLRWEQKAPLEK